MLCIILTMWFIVQDHLAAKIYSPMTLEISGVGEGEVYTLYVYTYQHLGSVPRRIITAIHSGYNEDA